MDSFQFSDHVERDTLKARIVEAQELGLECFLAGPEDGILVTVRPQDSPDISIDQLGIEDDVLLSQVQFSFLQPREDSMFLLTGCLVQGQGLQAADFERLFADHPIESIASVDELSKLFETYYGGGGDWRVWYAFIENLSQSVSDTVVETLVVPLLEAGELGFASREAERFLRTRGWSESVIKQSFCEVAAERRAARSDFQDYTGWSIDEIKSSNDLTDAFFNQLCEWGGSSVVQTICLYIRAQPPEADVVHLSEIVNPFLSMFGSGYEKIIMEIDERNDHYNTHWRYPKYTVDPSYDAWVSYGEWKDHVSEFMMWTGRAPQEIQSAEALAAIILHQESESDGSGNRDPITQQTKLSMSKNSIIESFALSQSSYANVTSVRAIVDPFVPFLERFGLEELKRIIDKKGWASQWELPPCDDSELWGDWREFKKAFGD